MATQTIRFHLDENVADASLFSATRSHIVAQRLAKTRGTAVTRRGFQFLTRPSFVRAA